MQDCDGCNDCRIAMVAGLQCLQDCRIAMIVGLPYTRSAGNWVSQWSKMDLAPEGPLEPVSGINSLSSLDQIVSILAWILTDSGRF